MNIIKILLLDFWEPKAIPIPPSHARETAPLP